MRLPQGIAITTETNGFSLTPSLEAYVRKRLRPLARYLGSLDERGTATMRVELGRTTRHHVKGTVYRAMVNLRVGGKVFRATDKNANVRAAVDMVREKLRREIAKHKSKVQRTRRRSIKSVKRMA